MSPWARELESILAVGMTWEYQLSNGKQDDAQKEGLKKVSTDPYAIKHQQKNQSKATFDFKESLDLKYAPTCKSKQHPRINNLKHINVYHVTG